MTHITHALVTLTTVVMVSSDSAGTGGLRTARAKQASTCYTGGLWEADQAPTARLVLRLWRKATHSLFCSLHPAGVRRSGFSQQA